MTELSQQIACRETALGRDDAAIDSDERFAALVMRQSRFVFRVAYCVLRNVHDSEDVVQETFLKLYRTGKWRSMDDERAFMARTAWRIAVDRLPKKRREMQPLDQLSISISPVQAVTTDWSSTVHRLINALPEELRQPLALSAMEELNSREIAGILGISDSTVRSRLMRARQILKRKVAALMGDHYGR